MAAMIDIFQDTGRHDMISSITFTTLVCASLRTFFQSGVLRASPRVTHRSGALPLESTAAGKASIVHVKISARHFFFF